MLNKDEKKILRTVKLAPLFISILSLMVIAFIYKNNDNQYNAEVERIRANSIAEETKLIKNEVLKVHQLIKNEKAQSIEKIKVDLQERVRQAHAIASAIYRNNQGKNENEIKQLISDALRDIRFNKGRGYFFVYQRDGLSVMHPILPDIQNTNLWDFQDVKGNYVIRQLSNIATSQGEGFLRWWWNKPADTNNEYEKIGYSKYFAPFDWFIGTGDYVLDYEEELKAEILQRISQVKYSKDGYIFVVNNAGVYLSHIEKEYIGKNRFDLTDRNGFLITQEIIKVGQRGEDYLTYIGTIKPSTGLPAHKTSYVKGYKDWQWAIGSGTYLDDIESLIRSKKQALNKQNQEELFHALVLGATACLILLLISLAFANNIEMRFLRYNSSVTEKTRQLNELNLHLEDKVKQRTQALAATNEELESTLKRLKSTQEKLIASEKMASMVSLVTGVAHELNTPLGIMVTSIGQIEREVESIFAKVKSQKLSRRDLQRSEELCQLGVDLLNRNLEKSIHLINSFKSLSTYNNQELPQEFSLNTLLQSLSDSYQSILKAHHTQLTVVCEGKIELSSFQEVIVEVLTQLIENSLTHGFTGIKSPQITLKVTKLAEQVSINYVDNGIGLDDEGIKKVFELFYTTKRNTNCTGLGMPIVYNQVTQKLLGSIEYNQQTASGVSYTITIPSKIKLTSAQTA
ncbi:cache domain-containing protein [Colwelliaceae bacterium MEBiC 14330]